MMTAPNGIPTAGNYLTSRCTQACRLNQLSQSADERSRGSNNLEVTLLVSEIILAAVEAQIPLAEQLGVQAAEALANADALRKMSLQRREERNQMSATGADVVDRERFRTGRAADIDDFICRFFEVDENPVPVAEHRADHQKTFGGSVFQFEGQAEMSLEACCIGQDGMPVWAVAFGDHFILVVILVNNHFTFLGLVPTQQ
jgi:hypothetical protein